jgi:hypothetical protein
MIGRNSFVMDKGGALHRGEDAAFGIVLYLHRQARMANLQSQVFPKYQ